MIERHNAKISIKTQSQLLGLSWSSLCYRLVVPSAQEIACKHRIDEIYTDHLFYGSWKKTEFLRREGSTITRPTEHKYMLEMGIAGIAPGSNLSKLCPFIVPSLLFANQNFNHVEEAIQFHLSVFDDARTGTLAHYPVDTGIANEGSLIFGDLMLVNQ